MDKKEINGEILSCLVKRSNLQKEMRELDEAIEDLNIELAKKLSRVVEVRLEIEKLIDYYTELKLEQQKYLE